MAITPKQIEADVMAHMEACWESLDDAADGTGPPSPAMEPFCGCDTCERREYIYATLKAIGHTPPYDDLLSS